MALNNVTFEQQVFELTNQERAKNGLPPLKANAELNYAADKYAQEMSQRGILSHTSPDGSQAWDRAKVVGYEAQMMGENIASGQITPQQVVQDWMKSPGHRANILKTQYTEIGIGFHNNYWVQDFGSGDKNPMSYIPNSTPNSTIASTSTPTPQSASMPTLTLDSVFPSDSVLDSTPASTPVAEPTVEAASDTDTASDSGELINNPVHDSLLLGGFSNNTPDYDLGHDTFMLGQVENFDWIGNIQFSQGIPILDNSRILEILPASQIDHNIPIGDRNIETLIAQGQNTFF
ncbi:CAP domain-containing protein [Scytonema tolypothrichoides VB-61278]|nr:CAP domain-containing protein [Scytonema tolypothrichoides VB-61278]